MRKPLHVIQVSESHLATFLSKLTDTSGMPQTNCSSLSAVYSDRMGTGIIDAMPCLTASACNRIHIQHYCQQVHLVSVYKKDLIPYSYYRKVCYEVIAN